MDQQIVFIAVGVSLSVLMLWVLVLTLKIRVIRAKLEEALNQNQPIAESVLEMGKRVVALQNELSALNEHKQNHIAQSSTYKAYSQAAELLEKGVALHEVMARCQLSKGEAELLVAMTNKK